MKIIFSLFFLLIVAAESGAKPLPASCVPAPPYQLEMTMIQLTYKIPTSRLKPFIPSPFKAVSIGGKSFLSVLGAHYTKAYSIPTGIVGRPYDEVVYATQVTYRGEVGNFSLKLHLNFPEAVEVGRKCYGYPKDLAQVNYVNNVREVSMESSSLTGETFHKFKAIKLHRPIAGIIDTVVGEVSGGLVNKSFFVREGDLVWAKTVASGFKYENSIPLQPTQIEIPFLIQQGLLKESEVQHPLGATAYEKLSFYLGIPTNF